MKKSVFLIALAAGLAQAAAPFAGWGKYQEIEVNTTNTNGGANVSAAQTNFPLLVRLVPGADSTGGNILSEALANGADIRFTDATGLNELPHEIEHWSTTDGAAIWVRVPSIAGNNTTKLRIYWNRAGAPNASNSVNVFGNNDFIGVWHMGTATGAAARVNAVYPGLNDAIPGGSSTASMTPRAGLMGMADSLRSQNSDKEASDHFNLGAINFPNAQITTSMWIRLPDPQKFMAWTHFFTHGNGNLDDNIWMGRENNGTNLRARGAWSGGEESDNPEQTTIQGGLADLETWIHIAVTKDSTNGKRWRVYKDGVPKEYFGEADNHTFAPGLRLENYIGRSLWADRNTHVKVDEMRTSRIARSPAWMKLEYETQKPGSRAVKLVGTVQTQAAPALAYISKNPVYLVNQAITANTVVSNGSPSAFSVAPALPAGLTLNASTGEITGTPTAVTAKTAYVVTATVGGNSVKDTLNITISGGTPPSAPQSVNAVGGLNQVTVTWQAPALAGTNPITSYKAMVTTDTSKSCTTANGTTLTCAITGLQAGTAYTVQVRAISNSGPGELSAASAPANTYTVPGAPSSVTAIAIANGVVRVNWVAPSTNGGSAVTGYKAWVVGDTLKSCDWTTGPLTCTISGLTGNVSFQVRAINAVGPGAPSLASASTPSPINGNFVIRMTGASKPFSFVLPADAAADEITMNISDVWGRVVWSKTQVPAKHGREIVWNGRNNAGRRVSAGMYVVNVSVMNGGKKIELTEKTVSLKP